MHRYGEAKSATMRKCSQHSSNLTNLNLASEPTSETLYYKLMELSGDFISAPSSVALRIRRAAFRAVRCDTFT